MIDTHAHLSSRFENEVDLADLKTVILAASNEQDSLDNLELAKKNPKLLPAVGIHPQELKKEIDKQIEFLDKLLSENKNIIAIGECGLELMGEPAFAKATAAKQEKLLRGQIALAIKYNKPLIIHSREASEEILSILSDYKNISGVIHCYTGGRKRINRFMELPGTWYLGIDGNVTYEVGLENVVDNIPKDRLILETDSPFLTPVPHRSEKNKPEYIKYIYEKVAEIWGMSFTKTEKIVDDNAKRLFGN